MIFSKNRLKRTIVHDFSTNRFKPCLPPPKIIASMCSCCRNSLLSVLGDFVQLHGLLLPSTEPPRGPLGVGGLRRASGRVQEDRLHPQLPEHPLVDGSLAHCRSEEGLQIGFRGLTQLLEGNGAVSEVSCTAASPRPFKNLGYSSYCKGPWAFV